MPDYKKITEFFDEYIAHYRAFLKFELAKASMINHGDIEQLSNSLPTEQALIMKTNVMESRRLKLVEGAPGDTFAELAEKAPEEYRDRLKAQHSELSDLIYKIKDINDAAGAVVSSRLKKIQRRTEELNVYDGKGSVKREHASKIAISKNV